MSCTRKVVSNIVKSSFFRGNATALYDKDYVKTIDPFSLKSQTKAKEPLAKLCS